MGNAEFSGNYLHNIDPKGRVTIPSAYREALGESFTLGLNSQFTALALYPQAEWEKTSALLNRIPASDARGMAYVRLIKAFSYTDQKLDGQGRILIPNTLRDKVGMDKAITFVGVGRFLEIWDTARFNEFCIASEESFADLANKHSDDGDGTTGGLYEDVYPGQMVTNFNDWCFDESRKTGDYGIVESPYGYHVMFYSGDSELTYRNQMVSNDKLNADLESWQKALNEAAKVEKIALELVDTNRIIA